MNLPDHSTRTAVVTGATSGIGLEAAAALAAAGADVTLTGRDPARGQAALATIRRRTPHARIAYAQADLSSLAAIAAFADTWQGRPLDILLNSAGVMALPRRTLTTDGYEMQFGTNHLGHFALTARLLPSLLAAAAPRVVTIASIAHWGARMVWDDLHGERSYDPRGAYRQSKLANLQFALELHRRARAAGSHLASIAAHPGLAATNIAANVFNAPQRAAFRIAVAFVGHGAAAGARPGLHAATAPDAMSGAYYGPGGLFELRGTPAPARVKPNAADLVAARRLWDVSAELTGVQPVL